MSIIYTVRLCNTTWTERRWRGYDGLCAHMAMVMMSFDLLALCQCEETDERWGTCSFTMEKPYLILAFRRP